MSQRFPSTAERTRQSFGSVRQFGATVAPGPPAVLDLLQHVEREGFAGAPRALGFEDQGREVLSYIKGEVGRGAGFIPDQGGRFDCRLPDNVWHDNVLVHLGADGSAWEMELARRGVLDEGALEIAWVEEHAVALVES